ncbi:MAG: hypothetical protein H0U52_02050 [Chloroflexi bacterium]|nr:hypothetical protein [Chloroflexota bacterium]
MELEKAIILVLMAVSVVRWIYVLAGTHDKPAEWQGPRLHTWPLRLNRDAYRVWIAVFVGMTVVLMAVLLILVQ